MRPLGYHIRTIHTYLHTYREERAIATNVCPTFRFYTYIQTYREERAIATNMCPTFRFYTYIHTLCVSTCGCMHACMYAYTTNYY